MTVITTVINSSSLILTKNSRAIIHCFTLTIVYHQNILMMAGNIFLYQTSQETEDGTRPLIFHTLHKDPP